MKQEEALYRAGVAERHMECAEPCLGRGTEYGVQVTEYSLLCMACLLAFGPLHPIINIVAVALSGMAESFTSSKISETLQP
jgi:hypothetical protein